MTSPSITDQQTRRRELLAAVNAGVDFGLPVPLDIRLAAEDIHFDSAADLCGWADWFGYTRTIPATHGQPHPDLADPAKSDVWLTNIYFDWRGITLHLGATDPITDEQRQHWIDSGRAAMFAEPEPEPESVDETRVYNRFGEEIPSLEVCVASLHIPEADAFCGWCGAAGMRSAQHVEVGGTADSDGCSVECACGHTVAGFDTLAEASAQLAFHIASAVESASEASR